MITRYMLTGGLAVAMTFANTTATAESAHVHGKGRLNIAIDGKYLFMGLESPGADIVGFERAPRTGAEKDAIASALAQLEEPTQLFRLDANAGCRVIEKRARLETGERDHDEHEQHDQHDRNDERHEHSEHDHDDEHKHDHDEHEDTGQHSAFDAEYGFECDDIDALTFIEITYFARFENTQSLDIVIIDGSGQRRARVDRSDPVLRLDR